LTLDTPVDLLQYQSSAIEVSSVKS